MTTLNTPTQTEIFQASMTSRRINDNIAQAYINAIGDNINYNRQIGKQTAYLGDLELTNEKVRKYLLDYGYGINKVTIDGREHTFITWQD